MNQCQHVTCRASQDRQDLQCQRSAGHEGNHLHTVALGWCRRPDLVGLDGRRGGHRQRVEVLNDADRLTEIRRLKAVQS